MLAILALAVPLTAHATVQDDINAKLAQIAELQKEIDAYQAQADQAGAQSKSLQSEIAKLNAQIGRITAQIKSMQASIEETGLEITQTQGAIDDAQHKITVHQEALASALRETSQNDLQPLPLILLESGTLSDFFDRVHDIQRTQDSLSTAIQSITDLRDQLDQQQSQLEQQKTGMEQLQSLQESQQRQLASTKGDKNKLLKVTQGQESKFQSLVKTTQTNLERLKEQIYYLQQNGISVDDAVKFAKLAAIGAGIRPAFLLALLETESRLGLNVGTGNWKDDMYLCYQRLANYYPSKRTYYLKRAEDEKTAFFSITSSLGLNPDTQKVSHEPSYGCGGAMGPAQFIPSTWLGYASAVIAITGRVISNPWNTEDAFTAAAVKLARGGASSQTRAGELQAAKAYISGNPNCSQAICNQYASTILQKAADIQVDL